MAWLVTMAAVDSTAKGTLRLIRLLATTFEPLTTTAGPSAKPRPEPSYDASYRIGASR